MTLFSSDSKIYYRSQIYDLLDSSAVSKLDKAEFLAILKSSDEEGEEIHLFTETHFDERGNLILPPIGLFRLSSNVQSVFLSDYLKISFPKELKNGILEKFIKKNKIKTNFDPWSIDRFELIKEGVSIKDVDRILDKLFDLSLDTRDELSKISPKIKRFQDELFLVAEQVVAILSHQNSRMCDPTLTIPANFSRFLALTIADIFTEIKQYLHDLEENFDVNGCLMTLNEIFISNSGNVLKEKTENELKRFIKSKVGKLVSNKILFSIPENTFTPLVTIISDEFLQIAPTEEEAYQKSKAIIEKRFFALRNPPAFVEILESGKLQFIKLFTANHVINRYEYKAENSTKKFKTIDRWRKDADCRTYDLIEPLPKKPEMEDFIKSDEVEEPAKNASSIRKFNSWRPNSFLMAYKALVRQQRFKSNLQLLEPLFRLIECVVGENSTPAKRKEASDYFIKWAADIF